MSSVDFEFELRPLDQIGAWGDEKNPTLHWFGLTDGLYRIRVGEDYLLSYTEAVRAPFARECPEAYSGPYVDYYVVRLWEDLIEMLPHVLEHVPRHLIRHLDCDIAAIDAFLDRAHRWWDAQDAAGAPSERSADIVNAATLWQGYRFLDNNYLSTSARIWMWSEGDIVTIAWDNRDVWMDGQPVWSAQRGTSSISREAFLKAIREFDRALIGQMARRVDQVCKHWNRPDIRIDFEGLKSDHRDRALRLEQQLSQCEFHVTDWNAVAAAIRTIEST